MREPSPELLAKIKGCHDACITMYTDFTNPQKYNGPDFTKNIEDQVVALKAAESTYKSLSQAIAAYSPASQVNVSESSSSKLSRSSFGPQLVESNSGWVVTAHNGTFRTESGGGHGSVIACTSFDRGMKCISQDVISTEQGEGRYLLQQNKSTDDLKNANVCSTEPCPLNASLYYLEEKPKEYTKNSYQKSWKIVISKRANIVQYIL